MPKNKGKRQGLVAARRRSYVENEEGLQEYPQVIGDDFEKKVLVPQSTPIHSPASCITPRSSHVSPVNNIRLPSYDFKEEEVIEKMLEITR